MLRRIAAWTPTACAIALLSAMPTAPATAQESSSTLEITVERPNAGSLDRYWLNCDPDFGTHPRPRSACEHLRAGSGDLERLRTGPAFCPRTDEPVRVRITGTWRGTQVEFAERYPNDCHAHAFGWPVVPSRWE